MLKVHVLDFGDVQTLRYVSCERLAHNASHPSDNIDWYWKLVPFILFGVGRTVSKVLLELIIAQSPDKMKGFVIRIEILFTALVPSFLLSATMKLGWTLCYDMLMIIMLAVTVCGLPHSFQVVHTT